MNKVTRVTIEAKIEIAFKGAEFFNFVRCSMNSVMYFPSHSKFFFLASVIDAVREVCESPSCVFASFKNVSYFLNSSSVVNLPAIVVSVPNPTLDLFQLTEVQFHKFLTHFAFHLSKFDVTKSYK